MPHARCATLLGSLVLMVCASPLWADERETRAAAGIPSSTAGDTAQTTLSEYRAEDQAPQQAARTAQAARTTRRPWKRPHCSRQ